MESLANLESFVRSAECRGFSAAARQLGLTPAAVSRNVAMLERNLGVRLFHRSTRRLTLTGSGENFLETVRGHLEGVQAAIAAVTTDRDEPGGLLKISVPLHFGMDYLLPLVPKFLARYPRIRLDWRFENRQVDLIAEGYDAAIGGGFELTPGLVSRPLAPSHIVAVASPTYLKGKRKPPDPGGLRDFDGIQMRVSRTGRIRQWMMRDVAGRQMPVELREHLVFNDPAAISRAALLGLGVAMLSVPDALLHLEAGTLVRLVPKWYADTGSIQLYYADRKLLAAKTRVFVDFVVEAFERQRLAKRFAGSTG